MVRFVQRALDSIEGPVDELLVSPSGSMLDESEVPLDARRSIFELMASFRAPKVCIETRAETVSQDTLDELSATIPGKGIAVEMGVESSSPWVRRFCINKMGTANAFSHAVGLLKERRMRVYANLALGNAFLSPAEAVADASRSVEWVLENGADLALVFPMHVKPYTLLEWLYRRSWYHPPSLWSLVEVLVRTKSTSLLAVSAAWFRCDHARELGMLASPSSCDRCRTRLLDRLSDFRAAPGAKTLSRLASESCECRAEWQLQLGRTPAGSLPERVLACYDELATGLGLSEWWAIHRHDIADEMWRDAPVLA
ncbi:MAG: hypothetical protein AB1806_09535 [Acidobacteriota bacterium]